LAHNEIAIIINYLFGQLLMAKELSPFLLHNLLINNDFSLLQGLLGKFAFHINVGRGRRKNMENV